MRLTFGDICFDPGTRQLWRGDQEIHLTHKAFELLGLLIERRPNAVSKPEIHARLWPDTFVADATLQSLVFEVREAIGDEARKPRFIRTVHGFGYAFSGPARETSSPAPAGRRPRGWLIGDIGRLPLVEGENVLGREGEDVVDLASPTVSRRHACISFGDEAVLQDLGSKNGTFVSGRQISAPVVLADGDQLRLGSVLVTFRVTSGGKDSTETVTPTSPPRRRKQATAAWSPGRPKSR